MTESLLEAWRTNQRVNLRLIDGIREAGMRCTLSRRGGRNVIRQFAHLQYVRAYQLRNRAKPLAEGIRIFDTYEEPDRAVVREALEDSSERIAEWVRRASEGARGYRTLSKGAAATIGYLIAHESHHRGAILLTLKVCGEPVDRRIRDGIWDWDRI